MAHCQVRVLTLNKSENLQHSLFRLEKGWYLRFVLGPSLHACNVRIFCNHPPSKDVSFERSTYYELEWKSASGSRVDSHDVYAGFSILIAGSFNYFFTIDGSDSHKSPNGEGYFLVDPTLSVGQEEDELTLDCLQCQSVLSKSLGPFDEWEGRLYVAKATGYNLIHFTPLQTLGQSNSSYSIADQLQLNPIFVRKGQNFDFNNVEGLIKKMNKEWGVLSLTDLVYNHTADNSPWLQEHPECGYNLDNSPYLKTAFVMDRMFAHFSMEVADGKWKHKGIPNVIEEGYILEEHPECGYNLDNSPYLKTAFVMDRMFARFSMEVADGKWKHKGIPNVIEEGYILEEHPECGYNLDNSPYLKTVFVMDQMFTHFSMEVADGKWKHKGIPNVIEEGYILENIKNVLLHEVIPALKMHEFYCVNVEDILKRFKHGIEENRFIGKTQKELNIIQDPTYQRNQCRVDMDTALGLFNIDRPGVTSREGRIRECCNQLQQHIEAQNRQRMDALLDHINTAVNNYIANVAWRFLDDNGPKIKTVTYKEPLMFDYFILPKRLSGPLSVEESNMYGENAKYIFASNGWVMGDDPLRNFAEPGSVVYLRRELVSWGDSVKLRYGQKPEDCPYLWQRMKEYTELTARLFHGVRLDNCHSTPIHVAEYMLDAGRKIRPDLYVVAELFTSSEHLDNIFINRLGINSLIREAMSAHDSHALGGSIHRYGGQPVGAFIQPRTQPLVKTMAHALFFDQTHDNESPIQKKSAYDMLPTAALVSMACCATGSNRGYDQLVPHHIHVVTEDRLYTSWGDWHNPEKSHINQTFGITRAKTLVNNLHFMMGRGSLGKNGQRHAYSQIYIDQVDGNCVSVTRHDPVTHESIVLVARTCFYKPDNPEETGYIRPVTVQGVVESILFEIQTCHTESFTYTKDKDFINGLPDFYLKSQENIPPSLSKMVTVEIAGDGMTSTVHFNTFTPGSVIAMKCVLPKPAQAAILEIRRGLGQFGYLMRSYSGRSMFDETFDTSNFRAIVSNLTLADLNVALFRCSGEESLDFGVYGIPGLGEMKYAGLRGVTTVLGSIRANNDLGHPLCGNLREGDWLPSHIAKRLLIHPGTKHLGHWFETIFKQLSQIPRFLIPSYFDAIITGAYVILRSHTFSLMSDFVQDGSTFVQALAMGSVMFCGYVRDAKLPELSPNLDPPLPPTRTETTDKGPEEVQSCLNLAAGFPHFASSYMRCWGRDTFIAMRGLLLLTGRYQEARYIILAFGGCLRHGLIPNLLCGGVGSRFNCRDAVWWWLQAVQDYCSLVPDGINILNDKVSRLFPTNDSEPQPAGECDQPLYEVMQEAIQQHATGLKYTERNAGPQIDAHMQTQGFNNEIGIDWETGFVFGGNEFNCGTWMDKMGSSERAGNRGKPATPRDGSAVELVGLSASAARWLHELNSKGSYKYSGVKAVIGGKEVDVSFKEWHDKIRSNFETNYWINTEPVPGEKNPELIFRRGIIKDTLNATQFWTNNQLRCNFPIAMVVAPELFTPDIAWTALDTMQKVMLGPLGMKTLDPNDWSYVGYYDNAMDGEDQKTAKGFSYHQGPEWVWPVGYFLRAKLAFARKLEGSRPGVLKETVLSIKTILTKHYEHVMTSEWRSLPEITNANGEPNHFGCPAQAWSVSCILEVLYDLDTLDADIAQPKKSTEDHVVAPI